MCLASVPYSIVETTWTLESYVPYMEFSSSIPQLFAQNLFLSYKLGIIIIFPSHQAIVRILSNNIFKVLHLFDSQESTFFPLSKTRTACHI